MSLTNTPWLLGIIKILPARESLVSDIPAGDGKTAKLFYSVKTHLKLVLKAMRVWLYMFESLCVLEVRFESICLYKIQNYCASGSQQNFSGPCATEVKTGIIYLEPRLGFLCLKLQTVISNLLHTFLYEEDREVLLQLLSF